MQRVIAIQFVTIDGVTQDPDGVEGFTQGWLGISFWTASCCRRRVPTRRAPRNRHATTRATYVAEVLRNLPRTA
jgi:hypothetical protein